MNFWDRFVLWAYLGLVDTQPVGRGAISRLFNSCFARGQLNPANLNDLSVLLILSAEPVGPVRSLVHTTAAAQVTLRGLPASPRYVWNLLQSLRPPRLTEWLELGRPMIPALRMLRASILFQAGPPEFVTNLSDFLNRLELVTPAAQVGQSQQAIVRAVNRYDRIPPGTIDFESVLYQEVLRSLQVGVVPTFPPSPLPNWFSRLPTEDQRMLTNCVNLLPGPAVVRLYLHFYARLSAAEISGVLQRWNPVWRASQVVLDLEQSWNTVLAGPPVV
jgi:hypothetical protein